MDRAELNGLSVTCLGPHPDYEAGHFFVCGICGQAVDMRRLGDVFHHEDEGHEPLPVN